MGLGFKWSISFSTKGFLATEFVKPNSFFIPKLDATKPKLNLLECLHFVFVFVQRPLWHFLRGLEMATQCLFPHLSPYQPHNQARNSKTDSSSVQPMFDSSLAKSQRLTAPINWALSYLGSDIYHPWGRPIWVIFGLVWLALKSDLKAQVNIIKYK